MARSTRKTPATRRASPITVPAPLTPIGPFPPDEARALLDRYWQLADLATPPQEDRQAA